MSLLGDKARRIDKMSRQEREVFASELEKLEAVAGRGLSVSPRVGASPGNNPAYFKLSGESNDAPLWSSADLLMYSDNGTTLVNQIANTGVIFNEQGSDIDFRIESDNQTHILVVNAGIDAVQLGTGFWADFRDAGVVFNENGANRDFRVEGDTDANLLFVDANIDAVGIGTATLTSSKLTLVGSMSLQEQAAADTDTAAFGQLWVKTATPNQLWFTDDAGTDFQLGLGDLLDDESFVVLAATGDLANERVLTGTANQITVTDGGAGAAVTLSTPQNIHTGASPTFAGASLDGAVTINDTGADVDLRIEGVTQANLFFVDASTDRVGIGTNLPGALLDVQGDFKFGANWTFDVSEARWDSIGNIVVRIDSDNNSPSRVFQIEHDTGANLFRVQENGRVGIGEASPDYGLDVNGTFGFTPGTSVTPVDNGDVTIAATNNTTLTFSLKGTDGTVRTGTITLA